VLEMGINQFGELTRLCGIARPTIGVLTNIGRTHLAGLKQLDGVASAKGELVASLPADGAAILNADDSYFPFLSSLAKGRVLSFGFSSHADVHITRLRPQRSLGWTFAVRRPGYRRPVAVRLLTPGRHNAANAAAAAAAGFVMGVKSTSIRNGLAQFRPMTMRTEIVEWNRVKIINDAYNANPTSMHVALEALSHMNGTGRRIAVLGDMLELGRAAKTAHQDIGALVAKLGIDDLIVCGSMGVHTAAGAVKAGMCREHVVVTRDDPDTGYPTLMACLVERLAPGDVVLVKGSRAMRMERIVECWMQQFPRGRRQAR
jgi:UDP-N-acetylmuramoyl-tripeptide--D-alanyl-D-alanine ligase